MPEEQVKVCSLLITHLPEMISEARFLNLTTNQYPINFGLGFFEIMSSNTPTMTLYLSQHHLQAAACDNHLVTEALITLSAVMPLANCILIRI